MTPEKAPGVPQERSPHRPTELYPDTRRGDWRACGDGWRHRTAMVASNAFVASNVVIAEGAFVDVGVRLGFGCVVGPFAGIGENARLGYCVVVEAEGRVKEGEIVEPETLVKTEV